MSMDKWLEAGAWSADITPPVGTVTVGAFNETRGLDILDSLYANALVLRDGGTLAAVISVDVCLVPTSMADRIRRAIESGCGIPFDNILICATHTHTGPELSDGWNNGEEKGGYYSEFFERVILSATEMAMKRLEPVMVGAGHTSFGRFSFNRRLRTPDGGVVMNWAPYELKKDCRGDGPVDPEVTVVSFETSEGCPSALIVNYANHDNAVMTSSISADYSGVMARHLKKVYGENVVVLFVAGAAGSTNWIDYTNPRVFEDKGLYKKIGLGLAGAVLEALSGIEYLPASALESRSCLLALKERPASPYDIEEDGSFGRVEDFEDVFSMYRQYQVEHEGQELREAVLSINVLKLGDHVALATNPCELFAEFGLLIRANAGVKYTLVGELTNGCFGYAPTQSAFAAGGYEVRRIGVSSFLEVTAGEKIAEACLDLMKDTRTHKHSAQA